jgi:hypothetical protein
MISPTVLAQIAKEVATAVVTRRDTTHLPTAAFPRPVSHAERAERTPAIRATIAAAAYGRSDFGE